MYSANDVAKAFLDTFDKSAIGSFKKFVSGHPGVRKWLIAADFSLHNSERPFDCFAFTIFPYDALPVDIESDATRALPKDLKKSKKLSDAAIEWLRDPRRFHIAITVNVDAAVFWNGPGSANLEIAREYIAKTLESAVSVGAPPDVIKRLRRLKQEAQAKNFNVQLLADIWLLTIWFAVLTVLLARERQCEIVSWFPDRDNMTNYCDAIWWDFASWNVQALANVLGVDVSSTLCVAGAPDRSGPKEQMWYDYMVRPADWFAGAAAAWDRKKNLIPADPKYRQMLEDVITPAQNIVFVHLELTEEGMQFGRVLSLRKNLLMRLLTFVANGMRYLVRWAGLLVEKWKALIGAS